SAYCGGFMAEYQNIRTGRHCAFILHAHVVFVTKHRHKVFKGTHLTPMEKIMRAVCEDFECKLVESNGENNHVHLPVNFPPKVALPKLVNSLKGASSRKLRQQFPSSSRTVHSSLQVRATLRIASPPP
uniref:IS200/IS605 family transposase n=1 Tax=Streptomyces TaxID=1883 RepID=UPI0023B047B1